MSGHHSPPGDAGSVVETAAESFKRRAKGYTLGDLDAVLDKVPNRPPEPGDELPDEWNANTLR